MLYLSYWMRLLSAGAILGVQQHAPRRRWHGGGGTALIAEREQDATALLPRRPPPRRAELSGSSGNGSAEPEPKAGGSPERQGIPRPGKGVLASQANSPAASPDPPT